MHTRRARAWTSLAVACGWVVLALVAVSPSTWGQSLPPGQPVALPVENNRCECILPISRPADKFFLFAKERDFYDPQSYVTVPGELKGVGRHCQVYVDRDFGNPSSLQPRVDDIIGTFDHEVYPRACRSLGRAADVDRDGRFTILLT